MNPFPWAGCPKDFASGREGARQDLASTAADLGLEPSQVGVEGFLEPLPGRFGTRRSEIPERLDPPASAFLVLPEIQVGSPANLFRGHAATELHGPGSMQPYSRLTVRHGRRPPRPLRFLWK